MEPDQFPDAELYTASYESEEDNRNNDHTQHRLVRMRITSTNHGAYWVNDVHKNDYLYRWCRKPENICI